MEASIYTESLTPEFFHPMNSPEIYPTEQIWNSLKIPITILAILGPIVIALLVFRFNRIVKRLNKKHQTNQSLVEKRIKIYDHIGPKLYEIFCFYCYQGNWKSMTPLDVIRLKKELDRDIASNSPIFSNDISEKYLAFIRLCYISVSGWEHKEKIKSLYEIRQEQNIEWNDDWIQFFDTKNVVDAITLKERYDELTEYFRRDLSI